MPGGQNLSSELYFKSNVQVVVRYQLLRTPSWMIKKWINVSDSVVRTHYTILEFNTTHFCDFMFQYAIS